jgi:hypothetical protein
MRSCPANRRSDGGIPMISGRRPWLWVRFTRDAREGRAAWPL